MTGSVGQKRVPASFLENVEIPLPPLSEQKPIVAKIEELLARVNATRERLAKVPAILKRFRQAVLTAACSGRLTEESERITVDPMAKPTTRLSAALREVVTGPFGSVLHKSDYVPGGVPIVNPMHINEGVITPTKEMAVPPWKAQQLSDFVLWEGDVVIARRGAMGRCAVVKPEQAGWLCGTGSMVLRPDSNLSPWYLQLFLSAPETVSALETGAVGSTMVNLNQHIVTSLEMWLPPLNQQQEIVRRVRALFELAETIEKRVATGAGMVERLTQTILTKAFRGELVPTEAELARRENRSYEPASELLARIKDMNASPKSKSLQQAQSALSDL